MTAKRITQPIFIRGRRLLHVLIGCAFASGAALAATTDSEQWIPGRILVQPKPGLPDIELEKILKPHGGKSIGKIEGINVHVVQLPANGSEKAVAALLAKNPHLKFAEQDRLLKPAGTANDPYFGSEWHLTKTGASTAWDTSTGGGITIAILDSGVDGSHPDLAPNLVAGWNFFDGNSNTSDVYGHGTQVAGSAAAVSNNAAGVASIASGARIMPIRVTDTSGNGSLTAIASGLTWAADQGARVANLSFYGVSSSSTIANAAQYLKNKGGLVTVSAGNYGTETTLASTDSMIMVSATDSSDVITSWSSYGNYVDLAAPGAGIWTTTNGGGYGAVSGTSFSSPITAGAIALVMAANPSLVATDVEKIVFSTAKDLGSAGWDKYYGYGRVDAAAAVMAAKSAVAKDTTAPSVRLTSPASGSTVSGLVSVSVSASDNVSVSRVDLVVNGTQLASDISGPYGFSWDSTAVADGNATLIAYAYDAAGNYSSSSVTVNVSNSGSGNKTTADTAAPTAQIGNPVGGAQVTGTVGITASASDNVGVTGMSLYIDGVLQTSTSGSTLSYKWNTRRASAGNHTIEIKAKDAAGNTGSQSVQVTK